MAATTVPAGGAAFGEAPAGDTRTATISPTAADDTSPRRFRVIGPIIDALLGTNEPLATVLTPTAPKARTARTANVVAPVQENSDSPYDLLQVLLTSFTSGVGRMHREGPPIFGLRSWLNP